jgi:glutathione S-transferase
VILWGRPSSVNVQKVLWALHELDLPYEHRIVGGKYGGVDDPAFMSLTPVRRVPVLQDEDTTLWESNTILRYLAKGATTPVADMWMEFGSTTLQPPFIGMFWQRVRMTPEQQDPRVLSAHLTALDAALDIFDKGLSDGRAYVAGPDFSMADIALGSLFYRITDVYPDILAAYPFVANWHASIASRDGYRQWIATSYDELKVTV